MRVITGQLRGYTGSVSIFGDKASDAACLKNIGYAPQPVSVFTALTASENLRFFGSMAGLTGAKLQERSAAVLEETGLVQYAHKKVSTYSGGMLRRLNLAVALLHEPRLLLLDEPTVRCRSPEPPPYLRNSHHPQHGGNDNIALYSHHG